MTTNDEPDIDRNFTLPYPTEMLNTEEEIYKDTVSTTLRKLLLGMYNEHDKQSADGDSETDQGTTRSLAGVSQSSRLYQKNETDVLAGQYAGIFKIAEYFTRSFDAVKGKYFEKVIAQNDPDKYLKPELALQNLPEYLESPRHSWNTFSYTESESEDVSTADYDVNFTDEDNESASADAVKYTQDNRLVFGEHRSTVVTGGSTARDSLFRKPKAIVEELVADDSTVTDNTMDTEHSLFNLIYDEMDISEIEFSIGILFGKDGEAIASRDDDVAIGATNRLMTQFRKEIQDAGLIPEHRFEETDDNLCVAFTIVDPSDTDDSETGETNHNPGSANDDDSSASAREIEFVLRARYGNSHLAELYGVEEDSLETNIRDIAASVETDDLWLTFSVVVHELQLLDIEDENGAQTVREQFLNNDELGRELADLRRNCLSEHPCIDRKEELKTKFKSIVERTSSRVVDDISPPTEYDDELYCRDLVRIVVLYHILSRPVFIERFPDPVPPELTNEDGSTNPLAIAHYAFIEYLFDPENYSRKKQNILRCLRALTKYTDSADDILDSGHESIDWAIAPTASEIGCVLRINKPTNILGSMRDRGIIIGKGDNTQMFAIQPAVAEKMGGFMSELTEEERDRLHRTRTLSFDDFPSPRISAEAASSPDTEDILVGAQLTLDQYVYENGTETASKRQRAVEAVRQKTTYCNSGTTEPAGPEDEIDWNEAPTKDEIGEEFDRTPTSILKSLAKGPIGGFSGVLEAREDFELFAMPAPVAARIDQPIPEQHSGD